MVMGFDDYSTSFQSMYSPMGNVYSTYNASSFGPNGAGAGINSSVNSNTNISNSYSNRFAYMDPLMNQINADSLIKNDKDINNYYTRPIEPHRKNDELGTILGIVGATLGTIALACALKGRFKKVPGSVVGGGAAGGTVAGGAIAGGAAGAAGLGTNAATALNLPPYATANAAPYKGKSFLNYVQDGLNTPHKVVTTTKPAYVQGVPGQPNPALSAYDKSLLNINEGSAASNLLKYNKTGVLTTSPVAPVQPMSYENAVKELVAEDLAKYGTNNPIAGITDYAKTGKLTNPVLAPVQPLSYENAVKELVAEDLAKYGTNNKIAGITDYAKSGIPTNRFIPAVEPNIGPVHLEAVKNAQFSAGKAKEIGRADARAAFKSPEFDTRRGIRNEQAEAAYNRVLGQQFKPGLVKDATRKDAAMAFNTPEYEAYYNRHFNTNAGTTQNQDSFAYKFGEFFGNLYGKFLG